MPHDVRFRTSSLILSALIGMIVPSAARPCRAQEQSSAKADTSPGPQVDYLSQIKPLLRDRCVACHGALKQEGGLRLDAAQLIMSGGDSGPAAVSGDVSKSVLLARVTASDIDQRMPPEHEGEPLSEEQIDLLGRWIANGALAPDDEQPDADPGDHWAFRSIVHPATPQVHRNEWVKNPIDAFAAKQHEERGLTPQDEASRLTLLRRLSLDLIGLPPTAEEITAFVNDSSPDWYEKTVERLLNDPRHGERWARHWMDIWRYSDWWGLGNQLRNSQYHIWHWRDWIVESLNADLPYDEMVRLMLAADELHPNDLEKLRASGYLARNYFLFNRNQWMDETVEHVSKGFLGLTMNCSKCHDHKYDPITQRDYYRMRAFFEPYHVRTDVRPGQPDLAQDGIPRAFDGLPEMPTYLFVRGQEKDPDKSAVLAPGVPDLLSFRPLNIKPVDLPVEAWQPERRVWVADAHRAAALRKIESARAGINSAKERLIAAEKKQADIAAMLKAKEATPDSSVVETDNSDVAKANEAAATISEMFTTLDATRWKLFGGEWVHEPGRLRQTRDGKTRAALRLMAMTPRDFDATFRVTILGGSQWRSVGISFDARQDDPSLESGAGDSEQSVYISAYAGGPKVQAAFHQDGHWQYPANGMVARPIELNKEYSLRVQVRDTLVNVSLNGEPAIAWRSPVPRSAGFFQLTTFDAMAVFHEVTIAPLSKAVELREAGTPVPDAGSPEGAAAAIVEAELRLRIAERTLEAAQAELQSVNQRIVAMQAVWNRPQPTDTASEAPLKSESTEALSDAERTLAQAAVRAERQHSASQARLVVAEAELKLHQASADKREAVTKELAAANERLDKALKQIEEQGEQYTTFIGAAWSPTRFFNSGADDPAVKFHPQSTGRRKALAEWITDRQNPLTARVAVNHIWMRHTGTPLVATVFDFGRKGSPPTNPELLDWLAAEFIESGWSMKHLHRLIVQSATYRLSPSTVGAEANIEIDRDNVFSWRRSPTRLESQAVRDSILSLAGTLDLTQGGPPVPASAQADSTRRSLYFFHSNNDRNLFLTMFDEALVKDCYRREQSIVPQQALALTNSRLVLDASQRIAERLSQVIAAKGETDDKAFARTAFSVLLAAEPNDVELAASLQSMEDWKTLPDAPLGEAAVEFARANLVWVLLNHNDFVTVR